MPIHSCCRRCTSCTWVALIGTLASTGLLCAAEASAPPTSQLASQPAAPTATVTIDNFSFAPATLTIAPGTTVTWINHDDVPHTATSSVKPRVFDSGTLDTDASYSFTFKTPGTYEYFCKVHPHMLAKIIVEKPKQ